MGRVAQWLAHLRNVLPLLPVGCLVIPTVSGWSTDILGVVAVVVLDGEGCGFESRLDQYSNFFFFNSFCMFFWIERGDFFWARSG